MGTRLHLPLVFALALGLAACRENVPATETPRPPFPTITPTRPPPTPTAVPSATLAPTATATLVPTATARPSTPTPTPVMVNGQPKMWWVDQMVKQPDGSYMAPEAVRQTIEKQALEPYQLSSASGSQDPLVVAKYIATHRDELINKYYTGKLKAASLGYQSDEVQIIVAETLRVLDIRAFSADGLSARVTISHSNAVVNIYSKADWSLKQENVRGQNAIEILALRFVPEDARWKYEDQVDVLYP